ncbi:unnamed protein product [Symbiodinium sp. CCMP2456]|nr:unnamed protein product [Symbiodinium sp. CCMP2456]
MFGVVRRLGPRLRGGLRPTVAAAAAAAPGMSRRDASSLSFSQDEPLLPCVCRALRRQIRSPLIDGELPSREQTGRRFHACGSVAEGLGGFFGGRCGVRLRARRALGSAGLEEGAAEVGIFGCGHPKVHLQAAGE